MRRLSTSDTANIEKDTQKDSVLKERIRAICDERPDYGYPRVSAVLNRKLRDDGIASVNRKKVYHIIREQNLLLKRSGPKPTRTHDGKIVTLTSDMRYASDILHISCWNGDLVRVAFVIDCCDREIIAAYATTNGLTGEEIRNLMLKSVESRFGGIKKLSKPIQWLSDNGPQYTSRQTVEFGRELGFEVCTTPSYCPESNGLAEGSIKCFKHDYVYVSKLPDGATVARQVLEWLWDYNENAPHKGLSMRSPREFRQSLMAS
jgi:putative transposase